MASDLIHEEIASRPAAVAESETREQLRAELEQRIRSGTLELPLLPRVAGRVLALARDDSSDAAALSGLIHQDQALATHVLRIANSALYLPRSRVASLQQAIARLGMRAITGIALAATLKAKIFSVLGQGVLIAPMWHKALASGTYAGEISRQQQCDFDTAFMCGLLHQIGRPIVLQAACDISREQGLKLHSAEYVGLLDDYHVEVGVLVAEKWALPEPLKVSIRFRERYASAPAHARFAMITHAAERFATHLLDPEALSLEQLRGLPVFDDLGTGPAGFDELVDRGEAILDLVAAMSL